MQIVYPSTPAQYFHVLRRQMLRSFRKPLIVMTPKSMLRNKLCISELSEFTDGNFQSVIDDSVDIDIHTVKRVILCSGKVYFDLFESRRNSKESSKETALIRIEELYPFPKESLRAVMNQYKEITEVCWIQEEAENMGAWSFVRPRLEALIPETCKLIYVGRDEAASPATGSHQVHQEEQKDIVERVLIDNTEIVGTNQSSSKNGSVLTYHRSLERY